MSNDEAPEKSLDFWIGIVLAIVSTFFNGSSPIITKIALRRLAKKENAARASEGGHGYLSDWIWWAGFICCKLDEILGF